MDFTVETGPVAPDKAVDAFRRSFAKAVPAKHRTDRDEHVAAQVVRVLRVLVDAVLDEPADDVVVRVVADDALTITVRPA
jgi:hypothetical protein